MHKQNLQPNQEIITRIARIAGLGDGVAEIDGVPVFIPFTAPGDEVRAVVRQSSKDNARADLLEIITPGAHRAEAACKHFGSCGGCSLQHLQAADYQALKHSILTHAVRRLGYDTSLVAPLVNGAAYSRRRADFTLQTNKGEVRLGFLMPRSHQLIDLAECPVMEPEIFALLAPLRIWAATLRKPNIITSIAITLLDNGLDLRLTLRDKLPVNEQTSLQEFMQTQPHILRISLQDEAGKRLGRISGTEPAIITLGGVKVELPEGAFLQASIAGQTALTSLVMKHTEGASRIADIYSGCGTYSFPLAARGQQVHALEGDAEMIMAVQTAIRRASLEHRMQAEMRDLFKTALPAAELAGFDAVVINPPRNGAGPQMKQIAKSGVTRVVLVSCNPATFERDAIELKKAGYALIEAVPVDQFYWSAHLELVASFQKAA